MILVYAVAAGLLAGLTRAWWGGRSFSPPDLSLSWLTAVAFLPQLLVFHLSATRQLFSDEFAAATLVSTQALLLIFVWHNRHHPGTWVLGLGLALNFLVIVANGGLMPISAETVHHLVPDAPTDSWQMGERLWAGKDIVLPVTSTKFWWLSDRFLIPTWFPQRAAFSLGDVLIAVGVFQLLWSIGEEVVCESLSPKHSIS